ncbi:hypothetical protein J6590_001806 [Homalodisca vitripennis]|nr:hypothetical protein J6590_001806 [Homalodisca vitripennis]
MSADIEEMTVAHLKQSLQSENLLEKLSYTRSNDSSNSVSFESRDLQSLRVPRYLLRGNEYISTILRRIELSEGIDNGYHGGLRQKRIGSFLEATPPIHVHPCDIIAVKKLFNSISNMDIVRRKTESQINLLDTISDQREDSDGVISEMKSQISSSSLVKCTLLLPKPPL